MDSHLTAYFPLPFCMLRSCSLKTPFVARATQPHRIGELVRDALAVALREPSPVSAPAVERGARLTLAPKEHRLQPSVSEKFRLNSRRTKYESLFQQRRNSHYSYPMGWWPTARLKWGFLHAKRQTISNESY